jgi:hypothetical protein
LAFREVKYNTKDNNRFCGGSYPMIDAMLEGSFKPDHRIKGAGTQIASSPRVLQPPSYIG